MTADRRADAGLMAIRTVVALPTPNAVLAAPKQLLCRPFRAPITWIMVKLGTPLAYDGQATLSDPKRSPAVNARLRLI
jgi:hypothetical protein